MSNTAKLTLAFLLLTSCDDPPSPSEVCDNKAVADFVIKCARAANPMSDEEAEDLVLQCERTALHLFCTAKCTVRPGWDSGGASCY